MRICSIANANRLAIENIYFAENMFEAPDTVCYTHDIRCFTDIEFFLKRREII